MKNSKLLLLLLLAMVILSIVSCTKDNIESPETLEPIVNEVDQYTSNALVARTLTDESDEFDLGCFLIQTPFELNVNGEIFPIETPEDFETALEGVIDEDDVAIDFVYPLTVVYEDGSTTDLADGEALGEAFAECVPDGGWTDIEGGFPAYLIDDENSCYSQTYPLTLTDLEGELITVANESAFIDALATHDILFFTFPLTLSDEDGNDVIANDDHQLFELFFDCGGFHPPSDTMYIPGSIGCYNFSFPFNVYVLDMDGNLTTVEISDVNDLNSSILTGDVTGLAFPLTLIDLEGNEILIQNEEELESALELCDDFTEPDLPSIDLLLGDATMGGDCYNIQFPITYANADNSVVLEVNSVEEALNAIFSNNLTVRIVYPLDVILISDGSTQTLNNEEEMLDLLEECE